jgi:peptidoglycan/xylan/chitin deacetylase (PgdA/CDA1 family)
MRKVFLVIFALMYLHVTASAQFGNAAWQGKKCAIVLTYDDAIDQHLDNAIPVLDSLGLKATFYITAFSSSMQKRLNDWEKLAVADHELGNHTLYHPCDASMNGRAWVQPENDLSKYTIKRMENEMRMTNVFLQALDGKTQRTFAYTCGDMKVADSAFMNGMRNDFVAARGVTNEMHKINEVDLYNTDCYVVNNNSFEEMKAWVDKAMQTNSLLVILFHGVGGGNGLDVTIAAHRQLLYYIKQNEKVIYTAPMIEVATHIKEWQARDATNKTMQAATKEDHQDMLKQLGITSLRPGANGNDLKAPNSVNYDEAIANPYAVLPDALKFKNGKKVTTAKDWWKRRKEIIEDFDREIYGRMPANTPKVNWEIVQSLDTSFEGITAVKQKLVGHVDNKNYPSIKVDIQLVLLLPTATKAKVPVIMEFTWGSFRRPGETSKIVAPAWQVDCLKRGWAVALLTPTSIQADNGAGLTKGVIGLMNKGERRKPDDWGSLRAWAWGAGRVMDYFETMKNIDAGKVAIAGHSRYGKAALVTMGYDSRFAIGYISSSGESGASLYRRNYGEITENVAASGEYHWMAGNFIKYAGPLSWNDLPIDAHELIALSAPRPIFIGTGDKGDYWADPKGMFMAAAAAGPVYKLLGRKDLGTTEFPAVETGLLTGEIAFRQHSAGHTPDPNWGAFLEYAARCFVPAYRFSPMLGQEPE